MNEHDCVCQECCNCHWYAYNNGEFECKGGTEPCEEYIEYKYLHTSREAWLPKGETSCHTG